MSDTTIPDALKLRYFDIIIKFGLLHNTGTSSDEWPDYPLRIKVQKEGKGCCTCYGKTLEEVCRHAYDWLNDL